MPLRPGKPVYPDVFRMIKYTFLSDVTFREGLKQGG